MKTSRGLMGLGLLSLSLALGADGPGWLPADEERAAQVRTRLSESNEAYVSALPVFNHGSSEIGVHHYGLTVTNRSGEDAEVVIEFLDGAGRALLISTSKGRAFALVASIPAGREIKEELSEGGELSQGWVRLTSSQPQVLAESRWQVGDREVRMKATEPDKARRFVLLDSTEMRLSLANPDTETAASVRLVALDSSGDELCSEDVSIGASRQVQGSTRQLLPCAPEETRSVEWQTRNGKVAIEAYTVRDRFPVFVAPVHEVKDGVGSLGKTYSVLAACNPTFSEERSDIISSVGQPYSIFVRASGGCNWSIKVPPGVAVSPTSGTNSKRILVTPQNWTAPGGRLLDLQVGGSRHQIRQQGTKCSFALRPETLQFPLAGDTKVSQVVSNCHWELGGYPSYIQVKPEEKFGLGSKAVAVYMPSTTRYRTQRIKIADKTLTLEQY